MNLIYKTLKKSIKKNIKIYIFISLSFIMLTINSNNLFACGTPPNANFDVDNTTPLVDETIRFTDTSTGGPTGWEWNFGDGANPATANTQGPHDVSYSTPGFKTISLTATNGNGDDLETKNNYIQVFVRTPYYSTNSGDPTDRNNWNSQPDGSGTVPSSTNDPYLIFIIQNGHTISTNSTWTLGNYSCITIQNGVLNENQTITIPVNGFLQIDDNGTLNHNVNNNNIFRGNITIGTNSTVSYGFNGAQQIIEADYGTLIISGGNTKTIQGNIRINNSLTLDNGNLSTGSGAHSITLAEDATLNATGGFSNSKMIVCDGSGGLIVEGSDAADFERIFPLGTGTVYSPMEISSLSASITGTGSISARTVGSIAPGVNASDLNRHWISSSSNLSNISANISFSYVAGDVLGNESLYQAKFFTGTEWTDAPGASPSGSNPFSTTGASNLDGTWTAREPIITYYSYQSGSWDDANTWTTDPSGTLSENKAVPSSANRVVILNGRTINIEASNKSIYSLQINEGGVLNLGTTTGHNLGNVKGMGLLRLSTNNFPGGDFTEFMSENGGTVEYYNPSANFNFLQYDYNNLTINFSNTGIRATVLGNMNIKGNLEIGSGIFRINNNTGNARTIDIGGSVTVNANGSIQVGTGDANHRFIVKGDFTNNGEVYFTNQTTPDYTTVPSNGRVDAVFNNTSTNQSILCNGITNFYRIEIDKEDINYILNIDATNSTNFKLFGKNDYDPSGTPPNIPNQQALGLLSGTVRLGENIIIPSIADAETYIIDEDAKIWLDGANVTFSTQVNTGDGTSFIIYGGFHTSGNSVFNDNSKQGIIMRTTASILFEAGSINTECVRTSYVEGIHRGAFTMTGGELTIRGANLPDLNGMEVYASFTLPYPDNALTISGGTINILSPNPNGGGSGTNFSYVVGANPNNISITGGEFNITVPTGRDAYIASTAPFWDLNIISDVTNRSAQSRTYTANGTVPDEIPAQTLVILNDLTLENSAVLTSGPNEVDVSVAGDFLINNGTTYTPGNNTTTFNGSGSQRLTYSGTITDGLYNLSFTNASDLTLDGSQSNLIVRNDLNLGSGTTLRDNTKTISVSGNITNSGTHFRPAGAAGRIELSGNADQIISGDGNGSFNNLAINKSGGSVSLSANTTINGNLRLLSTHRINIGNKMISLGSNGDIFSSMGSDKVFNNNKMLLTNGLASDGGIKKTFSSTNEFVYPFGFEISGTYYYKQASITYNSAPDVYGSITSRPVNDNHPLTQGTTNALKSYWKNTSNGFEGTQNVNLRFTYGNDLIFVEGTESNYVPGVYRNGTSWTIVGNTNNVNQTNNTISFDSQNSADGDYTAGETSAFAAIPVLYSRQSGDWKDVNTWSTTGHDGDAASITPTASTLVILGDGNTYNHNITIYEDNKECGGLRIASGSSLDIQATQGHNFASIPEETVTGAGLLRISSDAYFPEGDFGSFISNNGGTVEYYTNNNNITLPSSSASGLNLNQYYNLILSHSDTYWITLPNSDLNIHNDLSITGSGSQQIRTNTVAAHSIDVNGDLKITSGILQYRNDFLTTFRIYGNVNISSGAGFTVLNGGTIVNNRLELYGNLINNGSFNMVGGSRLVQTYFMGETNTSISGEGATYNFYNITIDKGYNSLPVLTLESTITTGISNPFLTLLNGTFRVNKEGLVVTITDGSTNFNIPSTTALSVQQGEVRLVYGNGNANLELAGKLEVLGGTMYIGDPTQDRSNSIEYASAGTPEINIENGALFVNGQIRRQTTTTSGSLNYIQSGGTTTIYGKVRNAARGLIEIGNTGSLFSMSGGNLQFDRPSTNGTSFGDLYIRPDNQNITGGTIQLGLETSTNNYNFRLSTSCPLWNVTVGNPAASQYVTAEIISPTILGNLTINAGSEFRANGLDLSLGGNLTNNNISSASGTSVGGYQSGNSAQTTILIGNNQQLSGTLNSLTNFANLTIESTGTTSLQPNTSIRINGNLTLSSGTLNDGENTISVTGNISNSATHISSTANGGITLIGNQNQILSGLNGVFGNIIIDNSAGITLINNATVNGKLSFLNGSFYIDDYLLTFGEDASIGGSPDKTKMLILNGALSDQGVRKQFSSGASNFTFPFGVSGKYTPATFDISSNTAPGTITIRPVNRKHPAESNELSDELQYYWSLESTGFENLLISHSYNFNNNDLVLPTDNYVIGRYLNKSYIWEYSGSDPGATITGNVNISGKLFSIPNVDFIQGDYTIGVVENFNPPLLVYYSRGNGNWTSPGSWSTDPVLKHDGAAASEAPNQNPMVIKEGHEIILDAAGQYSTSVEVNGTLDCQNTVFHNLGTVFGSGKVIVNSTVDGFFVFPGGSFDELFETSGSTVEFTGSNTASLPLKPGNFYKPFQNVIFSGSGTKNMSAENMKVIGDLTISNGTTLSNTLYNKNLYISGNWINENNTANTFIPGTGTVFFEGDTKQEINLGATELFYKFTMDNSDAGVELNGSAGIEISQTLTLNNGIIKSFDTRPVTLSNTSSSTAVSGGSNNSYVDGPLSKRIINGQSFDFPVGNDDRLGRIVLSNTSASSSPAYWTASYVNSNPDPTYPTAGENLTGSITAVSNNEYWIVNRPSGGSPSANISLRWDENSFPAYTNSASLRPLLRLVEYEAGSPGQWTSRGETVNGTVPPGSISTTIPVTNDDYIFSIGVIGVTASFSDLSPVEVCDNEEIVTIPVELTGSPNWELVYRIGTTEFTADNINSSPYNISIQGSDIGEGTYAVELVSVKDAGNDGIVSSGTVNLTVKLTHKPSIVGATEVGAGEIRSYTSAAHASSSYAWTWEGGSNGGSFSSADANTTDITFTSSPGTYKLRLTETSSSSCEAFNEIDIDVVNIPVPSINPASGNLCVGTTETYSTQSNVGNEYYWTVTGGTCTGCGTWRTAASGGNSIDVTWGSQGSGSIHVEERISASPAVKGETIENYEIYPEPTKPNLEYTKVCSGNETIVRVLNSQNNISYQLHLADDSPVGPVVSGNDGVIELSAGNLSSTTPFYVRAFNLGCEILSDELIVEVFALPTISIAVEAGDEQICNGDPAGLVITFSLGAGVTNFEITLTDNFSNDVVLNQSIGNSPYTYYASPTWDGAAVPLVVSTDYTYTAVIEDENNCVSNSPITAEVKVWKMPETGNVYTKSND